VFVGARLLCLQILPPYALQLSVALLKIRAKLFADAQKALCPQKQNKNTEL